MSNKAQSAWHGFKCDGICCRANRHLGVCPHYRVCSHHLAEDAEQARRDWTEQSALEIERAVQLASKRESARISEWARWR